MSFDVADDVINGAPNGWLVRKLHENRALRISFYSKEGAAAKGDPELAPRLVLEYGGSTAQVESRLGGLAAFFGAGRGKPTLKAVGGRSENSSLREYFQKNSAVAFAGEQVVMNGLCTRPLLQLGARVAYRSWLRGQPSLV